MTFTSLNDDHSNITLSSLAKNENDNNDANDNLPISSQISLESSHNHSSNRRSSSKLPKVDSGILFQSNNLLINTDENDSSLSIENSESTQIPLISFVNDSNFITDNGSIDNFNTIIKTSQQSKYPPKIKIVYYFNDLFRREINAPHSKTKEELFSFIEPYSIENYVPTHFRKQLGILFFSNQAIKELTTFSKKPPSKPLLEKIPITKKNVVLQLSTYILNYINVLSDKKQDEFYKNRPAEKRDNLTIAIVNILRDDDSLVDEFFMQMIKTMRNSPSAETLILSWKLFLTISSLFFVKDDEVSNVIRWFLIQNIFEDGIVGEYAHYTFIKFYERNIIARNFDSKTSKNDIVNIPLGVRFGIKMFKCSLYTQMWNQRREYPYLPIPLTLYLLVKVLIKNGALVTPHPFPDLGVQYSPSVYSKSSNNIAKKAGNEDESKKNDNANDEIFIDDEVRNKKEDNIEDNSENERVDIDENSENENSKEANADANESNNIKANINDSDANKSNSIKANINNINDSSTNINNTGINSTSINDASANENINDKKVHFTDENEKFKETHANGSSTSNISDSNETKNVHIEKSSSNNHSNDNASFFNQSASESSSKSSSLKPPRSVYRKADMKTVKMWANSLNEDHEIINDGEVTNLLALVFIWMLNLLDPIIPKFMSSTFVDTFSGDSVEKYGQFIEQLPLLHRNALKYIVGFLRDIAMNEKWTLENNESIAENIGFSFVRTSFITIDPFTRKQMCEVAPRFLLYCLERLDVRDVYPLNPAYEVRNKEEGKNGDDNDDEEEEEEENKE